MSDLISRSALLKKFNDKGIQITFDLPVEEILGEDVDIDDFTILVQGAIQAYKNLIIGTIKDMPTAYDAEKVVAELEEKQHQANKDMQISELYEDVQAYGGKYLAFGEAIEIVKAGGVDE